MKTYQFIVNHVCNTRFMITVAILLQFQVSGYSQVRNVWALGDGEKVYRNEDNHADKNGNLIWDGNAIRLQGLYNEVLAFQVIV